MGNLVLSVMEDFGYIGIFFLIAVENLFPPIPSEVILTFGGFLTTYSSLSTWGVVIAATIGSLVGAIVLYYTGTLIKIKDQDMNKTNDAFIKYGYKAVFWGRFIPIVRSLISIPAGSKRMPLGKFFTYTLLGSLGWNIILVNAGAMLGDNWSVLANFLNKYSTVVLVLLIISCMFKLLKWLKKKNRVS